LNPQISRTMHIEFKVQINNLDKIKYSLKLKKIPSDGKNTVYEASLSNDNDLTIYEFSDTNPEICFKKIKYFLDEKKHKPLFITVSRMFKPEREFDNYLADLMKD
jgi:hypothetical protein